MRKLIKKLFLATLYFFYYLLIKSTNKGKKTIPKNFVRDIFEVYSINECGKEFLKIALPYSEINHFNRHDLNRPYEVLRINLLKKNEKKEFHFQNSNGFVLPVAILDKKNLNHNISKIKIEYGTKINEINLKTKNRFHYLPIKTDREISRISICSFKDSLGIGEPIFANQEKDKLNPKLIVHIFVDALSQILIDNSDEELMPNIKKYFSQGVTFKNAFSQADWTLSSISGAFTGKYTKDHLVYHPRRGDKILSTTISEILKKEGYITSFISSIPKLTPLNGFDKGFDRCVIAPFRDANFVINEAIEQLDSFDSNQYLFLGMFDIHEANEIQSISTQINNDLENFNYRTISTKNPLTPLFDEERIKRYQNSLKHFDSKLERLFKRIDDYDERATVILHSDHGVDFITKNSHRLSKERQKVALMCKGSNVKTGIEEKIREIREVPSLILNASKINNNLNYRMDGYAITESIYPNQDYELALRDDEYVLFFSVPWKFIKEKNSERFEYKTSFYEMVDESTIIESNSNFEEMLNFSKNHYKDLINNLKISNR